jgi:hypothetical protein
MDQAKLREHLDAIKSPGSVNPAWKGVADATHAFAKFLADLAIEAERSQRRLMRLTSVLLIATISLLVIAAIQTVKMFISP